MGVRTDRQPRVTMIRIERIELREAMVRRAERTGRKVEIVESSMSPAIRVLRLFE